MIGFLAVCLAFSPFPPVPGEHGTTAKAAVLGTFDDTVDEGDYVQFVNDAHLWRVVDKDSLRLVLADVQSGPSLNHSGAVTAAGVLVGSLADQYDTMVKSPDASSPPLLVRAEIADLLEYDVVSAVYKSNDDLVHIGSSYWLYDGPSGGTDKWVVRAATGYSEVDEEEVDFLYGVRPALTLTKDTLRVKSGLGTSDNPYVLIPAAGDTAAPVVTVTRPAANRWFNLSTGVEFEFSVELAEGASVEQYEIEVIQAGSTTGTVLRENRPSGTVFSGTLPAGIFGSDGEYDIVFTVTDDFGGEGSATVRVGVDIQAPVPAGISVNPVPPSGWYNGPVTLTFGPPAVGPSGTAGEQYAVVPEGSGPPEAEDDSWEDIPTGRTVTLANPQVQTGIYEVYTKVVNHAGTVGISEEPLTLRFDFDTPGAPIVEFFDAEGQPLGAGEWTNGGVTARISGGQPGPNGETVPSGIAGYEWRYVSETDWNFLNAASASTNGISFVPENPRTIEVRTVSRSDQRGGPVTVVVPIDTTVPLEPVVELRDAKGTVISPGAWAGSAVSVSVYGGDKPPGSAPVDYYEFQFVSSTSAADEALDGLTADPDAWETFDSSEPLTLKPQVDGTLFGVLFAKTVDKAGNESGIRKVAVRIDTNRPDMPIVNLAPSDAEVGNLDWYKGKVGFTIVLPADQENRAPIDPGSVRYQYTNDSKQTGVDWQSGTTGTVPVDEDVDEGIYTLIVTVKNVAGIESLPKVVRFGIDLTAPTEPEIYAVLDSGLVPIGTDDTNRVWTNDPEIAIVPGEDQGDAQKSGVGPDGTLYRLGWKEAGEITYTPWSSLPPDLPDVPDGRLIVQAKSVDAVGHESGVEEGYLYIDRVAPDAPEIRFNPSGWTNGNVTATLVEPEVSADESPIAKMLYRFIPADGSNSDPEWIDYSGSFELYEHGWIEAKAIDEAGNASDAARAEVLVDKTAGDNFPLPIIRSVLPRNFDDGKATVEIVVRDLEKMGPSGLKEIKYSLWAEGSPRESGQVPFSDLIQDANGLYLARVELTAVSADAANTLLVVLVNNAGTEGEPVPKNLREYPAPVSITVDPSGWSNGPKTVTIEHDDDNVTIKYRLGKTVNGSVDWEELFRDYTGDFRVQPDDGYDRVEAYAIDPQDGSEGDSTQEFLLFDTVSPLKPAVNGVPNDWSSEPVELTVVRDTSDTGSPVVYRYLVSSEPLAPENLDSLDSGAWTDVPADGKVTISNNGITYFYAYAEDQAGNRSEYAEAVVRIDQLPMPAPIVSVEPGSVDRDAKTIWTSGGTLTIRIRIADDDLDDIGPSGLEGYEWTLGADIGDTEFVPATDPSDPAVLVALVDNPSVLIIRAVNHAGTSSENVQLQILIDTVKPGAPDITLKPGGWTNAAVEAVIENGTAGISGVAGYQYLLCSSDNTCGSWLDYAGPVTIAPNEDLVRIEARTINGAGAVSVSAAKPLRFDTTAPNPPVLNGIPDEPVTGSVRITLALNPADQADTGSPIRLEYRLNGAATWTRGNSVTITEVGTTIIEARAVDEAGNVSATTTGRVTIRASGGGSGGSGGGGGGGGGGGAPSGGGTGTGSTQPSSANRTQTTIPAGQSAVASLGNEITVQLPAGATNQQILLTIERVANLAGIQLPDLTLLSPVFELLKNVSGQFLKPVTIKIVFDPSKLKADEVPSVFYYDEVKKEWVELGGTVSGNTITVDVDHFTKFAVFAVPRKAPQQPPAQSDDTVETPKFRDITSHWAEGIILEAARRNIVGGYPDGTFRPNQPVTRAEFISLLVRTLNLRAKYGNVPEPQFADTLPQWAASDIAIAVHAGIVGGYEDGTFGPHKPITRAEVAVIIKRAIGDRLSLGADDPLFADETEIPGWALSSVKELAAGQLMIGRSVTTDRGTVTVFAPNAPLTRAEATALLLRIAFLMQ